MGKIVNALCVASLLFSGSVLAELTVKDLQVSDFEETSDANVVVVHFSEALPNPDSCESGGQSAIYNGAEKDRGSLFALLQSMTVGLGVTIVLNGCYDGKPLIVSASMSE